MRSMDNSIQKEYEAGHISADEAYSKASDKGRFLPMVEAEEKARLAAELAAAQNTAG